MKRVTHNEKARDRELHIEAVGCTIDVRIGLTTFDDEQITSIYIRPDKYGDEDSWYFPDLPLVEGAVNIRVAKGQINRRFHVEDNGKDGPKREVYLDYVGRRWTVCFQMEGLRWASYVRNGSINLLLERYDAALLNNPDGGRLMWAGRTENAIELAKKNIKAIYRLFMNDEEGI